MKLKKIFAALTASALAATMAISASAEYKITNDQTEEGKTTVGFEICAPASKQEDGFSVNTSDKPVTDTFDISLADASKITSVVLSITNNDGADWKWFNGKFYAAGNAWKDSGSVGPGKATDLQNGATVEIPLDFTPATSEDGKDVLYAVGWEEYGAGNYTVNSVTFKDAAGAEIAKWTGVGSGTKTPGGDSSTTTPGGDSSTTTPGTNSTGGTDSKTPGTGIAGLAMVTIALAGASVVATKKRK